MPDADLATYTLDVPDARLYYERRGAGPLLLMIGSPMDSTGFAGLASALAGNYTVVTHDPRGIGNSSREGPDRMSRPSSRPTTSTACCRCSAANRHMCSAAAAGPWSGWR